MSALFTGLYKEEGITAIGYANGIHSLFISVHIQAQTVNPFKPQNMLRECRHFQNACLS
jgi:hypothetical protein